MPARLTSSALLAAAALATLGACADSARLTAPTSAASADRALPEFNQPNKHIFHTREYFAREDASNGAQRSARPSSGTGISYHGGQLLTAQTKVAAVYWATSPIYANGPTPGSSNTAGNSGDNSLVGYFLSNLGPSTYFNINTTYYQGTASVQNNVAYTQYWANNSYNVPTGTASVSDADMLAMLTNGFQTGQLKYDSTTVYAIFTAGSVNLGGGFVTQYCAYHTHGTVSTPTGTHTVLYAAMPYNASAKSSCTSGFNPANGATVDPGADYEVNTLAHEIEETTTDMMGNAWYDSRGYENADKCAWTWGSTAVDPATNGTYNMTIGTKKFLVQQNWVNANSGGCALHL